MTNLESDMTFPTYGGEVKPATGATLFALGSWLRRGKASADARQLFLDGGREGDSFYRDRWSYDKIVRSTHGVNCTGSCSWKIYVKDGVITWETQQTDYPSTGADMPEYEPRGCPRGAAFSWYEYSPTRIKYPYVRGVLLDMFREAKKRLGDPSTRGPRSLRTRRRRALTSRSAAAAAWSACPGKRRWRSSPPPTCTRSSSTARTASPASR